MDNKAKETYRRLIQPRYQRATKVIKKRILDEFCAVCGFHRKYAISLLKQPVRIKKAACLVHLAKGLTAKQIGNEMNISSRTVESHIDALKIKFNCYNKKDLIKIAWGSDFIEAKICDDL